MFFQVCTTLLMFLRVITAYTLNVSQGNNCTFNVSQCNNRQLSHTSNILVVITLLLLLYSILYSFDVWLHRELMRGIIDYCGIDHFCACFPAPRSTQDSRQSLTQGIAV